VSFKETLEVEFKGKIEPEDDDVFRVNIDTIPFAKQPFTIGIIPGYISYEADVNLVVKPELESSASAQSGFTQELKGGFTWNENRGLDWVKGFKHSSSGVKGNLTTKLKTKVYVEIVPKAAAYSIIGPEMSLDAGLKFVAGSELKASADDVTEELFAKLSFFAAADLKAAVKDFDQKFLEKIFGRFRELLDNATKIQIMGEKEWLIKEWRVFVGAVGEQPPFLEVEGDRREYRTGVENTEALPDVLATYRLTNTGGKDLEWEIKKSGRLFDDAAWIDITPWGTLAPEESATAKIVWQDGFAKTDLTVGDYRGTLDFIVKGRENYPDAQTGATRREIEVTVDETLDPGSVSPVIDQWPDTAPAGSKFIQKGSGFTPNSPVVIHVRREDGSTYTPDPAYADSSGNFYVTFTTSPHRTPGDYAWWAEDVTGALSSELTYTITAPGVASGPANFQDRDSGVPGTDFIQWGYGFTPNGTVTIHVRHPDGSETLAETVTADPEGWFYTVYSAAMDKPSGTYRWWAVDETRGQKSGELSYTIAGGGPVGDSFTNDLGMTFVRIPAGTFMMGSPEDELGRDDDETLHQVTLTDDFYMMTTEVTQDQWEAVMGSNPSHFDECGGDCPVEMVSWIDVQDFILTLNAKDSRSYRLPTEAEWEYATRAGTTTAFYSGGITIKDFACDLDPKLNTIGWYCGNSGDTTHPVGQKQPNFWGLYDMSGNVCEWCQDWYGTYPENDRINPSGPSSGVARVIRGGGWYDVARRCRSASRTSSSPGNQRNSGYGFRLALSPSR
jgi:formylglycine-generating enzyme required for sulfatase activity